MTPPIVLDAEGHCSYAGATWLTCPFSAWLAGTAAADSPLPFASNPDYSLTGLRNELPVFGVAVPVFVFVF